MAKDCNSVYQTILARKPQFVDTVKQLLERGEDSNEQNEMKFTSLFLAVTDPEFSEELTALLIKHGAHVNALSHSCDTVLHHAIEHKNLKYATIRLLIQNGALVNARNIYGETPLYIAVKNKNCGPNVLEELLLHHADPNIPDIYGSLPLVRAVMNTDGKCGFYTDCSSCIQTHSYLKLKMLINYGGRIDDLASRNIARKYFHPCIKALTLLVEKGYSINSVDCCGETILHKFMLQLITPFKRTVLALLELGADVNAPDQNAFTPFQLLLRNWTDEYWGMENQWEVNMYCDNEGCCDVFNSMLERSDPNAKTTDGCNALHLAAMPEYKCRPPHECVGDLVKHGVDINSKNDRSRTPLAEAVLHPSFNATFIQELIRCGADVDCQAGDPPMSIVYHAATTNVMLIVKKDDSYFRYRKKICNSCVSILRLLLKHGASLLNSEQHCSDTLNFVLENSPKFADFHYRDIEAEMYYQIATELLNHGAFVAMNEEGRERIFKTVISSIHWDFTYEEKKLQLTELCIKFFALYCQKWNLDDILLESLDVRPKRLKSLDEFKVGYLFFDPCLYRSTKAERDDPSLIFVNVEPRPLMFADKCKAEIDLMDKYHFFHKKCDKIYCRVDARGISLRNLLLHLLSAKVKDICYFKLFKVLYGISNELEIYRDLLLSNLNREQLQNLILEEEMFLPVPKGGTGQITIIILWHVIQYLSVEDMGNYIICFLFARKGQSISLRNSKQKQAFVHGGYLEFPLFIGCQK